MNRKFENIFKSFIHIFLNYISFSKKCKPLSLILTNINNTAETIIYKIKATSDTVTSEFKIDESNHIVIKIFKAYISETNAILKIFNH